MRTTNVLLIIAGLYAGFCKGQADSIVFEKKSSVILRNIFYAGYPAHGRMILSDDWLVFKPKPSKNHFESIWIKDVLMQINDIKEIRRNWCVVWPFKLRVKMKNGRVYRFAMCGQRKKLITLVQATRIKKN